MEDLATEYRREAYQKGFKDGFMEAMRVVKEDAKFHEEMYKNIFEMHKKAEVKGDK